MGLHDGHRARLKDRYLKEGGKHFAAHNLLEMLLFYGIPRKDTNEIAHKLIHRFGDVGRVLSAPVEELCKISGVSENVAILLRLTGELGTRFCADEMCDLLRFYSYDDIGKYLVSQLKGAKNEVVLALYVDPLGRLITQSLLCEGGVNSVNLDTREIVSTALGVKASAVVLAHNHPDGLTVPSPEDIDTTRTLCRLLEASGLELVEHYIVAGKNYGRIMEGWGSTEGGGLRQHFSLRREAQ
ncbi:MAG: RadC family protein [Clostridia bacterium]|nr:RadC family protein [Clostridia bacterium]